MEYYFAPLEGITTYIYRHIHHKYYSGIDKYFMPFIGLHHHHHLRTREQSDIDIKHNKDIRAVPQLLSKDSSDVINMLAQLERFGYNEVNINLGCPSRTVTAKGKGAAMLADLEKLQKYLDDIFTLDWSIDISVKTRIGMDHENAGDLIALFNQYPISELIVHARTGNQMYKGKCDKITFKKMYDNAKVPIVYNGDIKMKADINEIRREFPNIKGIMIGRGLIACPELIQAYIENAYVISLKTLIDFHDDLLREYFLKLKSEKDTLFKMKELWSYMSVMFNDCRRPLKRIRKASSFKEYEKAVEEMFNCRLVSLC